MADLVLIFGMLLAPLGLVFMLAAIRHHTTGVAVSQLWKPFVTGSVVGLLIFLMLGPLLEHRLVAVGLIAALAAGIVSGWLLRKTPRTWSVAGLFAATASFACMGAVAIWIAIGVAGASRNEVAGDFVFAAYLGAFGVWMTLFPFLLFTAAVSIYIFRPAPAAPGPAPYAGPA